MATKNAVRMRPARYNTDRGKVLGVLSRTEWLSTAQVRDRTGFHNPDKSLDHLHALNGLWIIDMKVAATEDGGYGYFWRRR